MWRAAIACALGVCGQGAYAQIGGRSLQSQASDPTASLMSFQFQNFYTPNRHKSGGSQNIAQLRAAIPVSKLTKPGGVPVQWQLSYERISTTPAQDTETQSA